MKKMRKAGFALLLCGLLACPLPGVARAAHSFTDVQPTAWYYDAVQYAYETGMMSGTGNGKFSPEAATSRAMIVTVLHNLEGKPTPQTEAGFADVPENQWYTDAVNWAHSRGIASGYGDGNFGPEDPISREQVATMLYQYAQDKGYDTSARGDLHLFTDHAAVSSWAEDALRWANGAGVVNGTEDFRLNPGAGATRAETAAMLKNFRENCVPAGTDKEETIARYDQLEEAAQAIQAPYMDADGYVEAEDAPRVLDELAAWGQGLLEDGKISDFAYQEGDSCVYAQLDGWLGCLFGPRVKEAMAGGEGAVSIATVEPFASDIDHIFSYMTNTFRGPDEAAGKIEKEMGDGFRFTEDYDDEEISLDTFEALFHSARNKILLWAGHGALNEETGSVISLGKKKDVGEIIEKSEQFNDGSLLLMGDHYVFTSAYFEKHVEEGALSGSLVYFGSCYSAADDRLAKSMMDKGARCFVGNSGEIWAPYNFRMMYSFAEGLTRRTDSGEPYTVRQAVDYAKDKNGAFDVLYGAQVLLAATDDFTLPEMLSPKAEIHDYVVFYQGTADTWEEAQAYCQSIGGHLATITSQEENDYVYGLLQQSGTDSAYFGLTDSGQEGRWEWVTGEPVLYTNWHAGEPNGENSGEDYAMFYSKFSDGSWNDGDFGGQAGDGGRAFICEFDMKEAYEAFMDF